MSEVQVGRVKWFNGSRGFGFITNLSSNEDIFVHHSSLVINTTEQTDFWKTLYQGEYVQFSVSTEEEKQQAVSVTGIQSGPLQCESRPRRRFQRRRTLSDTNNTRGGYRGRGRGRGGRRLGSDRNQPQNQTAQEENQTEENQADEQ